MYRTRTLCPAHEKNAGDLEMGHESIRFVGYTILGKGTCSDML
jgi:hypothetical protein